MNGQGTNPRESVLDRIVAWGQGVANWMRGEGWSQAASALTATVAGLAILVHINGIPGTYSGILNGFPLLRLQIAGSISTITELVADALDAGTFADANEYATGIKASLVWDVALIAAYSVALPLACIFFRKMYQSPFMSRCGPTFAAGVLIAAGIDLLENLFTWMYVSQPSAPVLGMLAASAWVKWTLLLLALLYVGFGLVLYILRRWIGAAASYLAFALYRRLKRRVEDLRQPRAKGIISQDLPVPDFTSVQLRPTACLPPADTPTAAGETVGVCSSGGGLRSATFNLGAYQALEEEGIMSRARYIAAVSGGAYIASGYTAVAKHLATAPRAQPSYGHNTPEEDHFRSNSNYLAPTFIAKAGMIGRVLLGLALNLVFVGSVIAIFTVPWGGFMSSSYLYPETAENVEALEESVSEIAIHADSIVGIQQDERGLPSPALPVAGERLSAAASRLSVMLESLQERRAIPPRLIPARRSGESLASSASALSALIAASSLAGEDPPPDVLVIAEDLVDDGADLANFVRTQGAPDIPLPGAWLAVLLATAVAGVLGLISVGIRRANESDACRCTMQRIGLLMLAVGTALFLTLVAVPWALVQRPTELVDLSAEVFVSLQTIGAGLLGIGAIRAIVAKGTSHLARLAGGLVAPLMAILAAIVLARVGARTEYLRWWIIGPLAIYTVVLAFGDLNVWSLHPWYRRRLASAFAMKPVDRGVVALDQAEQKLSTYGSDEDPGLCGQPRSPVETSGPSSPELVICAAANVAEPGITPTRLNALSYTLGGNCIGIPGIEIPSTNRSAGLDGMVPTREVEARVRRQASEFTLSGAVAISGAAISPSMGKMTRPSIRALLALANVRLGVWLPNPVWLNNFIQRQEVGEQRAIRDYQKALKKASGTRSVGIDTNQGATAFDGTMAPEVNQRAFSLRSVRTRFSLANAVSRWSRAQERDWVEPVRATYLFKEIFGIYRLSDKFVYVSDGGHWENLGLVELLRRGCTQIYCFDASGDPSDRFKTLSEAVAIARTEFGVQLGDLDPFEQQGVPTQETKDNEKPVMRAESDHTIFHFTYGNGVAATLVYCKPAVTERSPFDVHEYQEAHPEFPAQSTLDQFYDHEQFESYRMLGYTAALNAVKSVRKREESSPKVSDRAEPMLRTYPAGN